MVMAQLARIKVNEHLHRTEFTCSSLMPRLMQVCIHGHKGRRNNVYLYAFFFFLEERVLSLHHSERQKKRRGLRELFNRYRSFL